MAAIHAAASAGNGGFFSGSLTLSKCVFYKDIEVRRGRSLEYRVGLSLEKRKGAADTNGAHYLHYVTFCIGALWHYRRFSRVK